MTPQLELVVGGQRLQQWAAWSDLAYSFVWPGGCKEASATIPTRYSSRLSALVKGADVQVLMGGWPLWRGTLTEPAWNGNTVTLTANGLHRLGENYPAFDSAATMNTVTNPTTAVTTAISMGLPWTIDTTTVPNSDLPAGPSTDPANTVTELLNAWSKQLNQRWYVDQFGVLRFAADPTVPTLVVRNGSGDLGIADDDYASNVVLRYADSGTGTYQSASFPLLTDPMDGYGQRYGRKVSLQDITDQGSMSAATAAGLAQNTYLLSKQRPGWTNGLQLNYGELLTPGGKPVHGTAVDAFARMVQVHGVPDEVALTSYTNFVVGDTAWSQASPTQVTINPQGLAARTTEDVLAELVSAALSSGAIAA